MLREKLSKRTMSIGVLGGIAHLLVVIWIFGDGSIENIKILEDLAIFSYFSMGVFLLGTIPIGLPDRKIFSPWLSITIVFIFVLYGEWKMAQSTAPSLAPTPGMIYGFFWFIILALALLLGASEYWVKEHLFRREDSAPS